MSASRSSLVALVLVALLAGALPIRVIAQQDGPRFVPSGLDAGIEALLATQAEALGGEPAAVADWVREQVAYEAYPGVLRGARGAYLAGAGNAADTALLVAYLIRAGDPSTALRFAACEATVVPRATAPDPPLLIERAGELAALVDDPELAEALLALADRRAALRVESQRVAQALAEDLRGAGYPWPRPSAGDVPGAGSPAGDPLGHVWVQVAAGDEWVDVDPTAAERLPGCEPTATYDSLPDGAHHEVRIRVVAEERQGDELHERTLLSHEVTTADALTSSMALVFGEPAGLVDEGTAGGFGFSLDDGPVTTTYTPTLRVDGASIVGDPLELPAPAPGIAGEVGDAVGGAMGLFDELPAGGEEAAGPGTDGLSAVWLDIELVDPAGEATSLRSEVLDRLGIAARGSGDLSGGELAELEVVDGEYLAFATLWQVGLLSGELRAPAVVSSFELDPSAIDGLSGSLDLLLRTYPALARDFGALLAPGPSVVLAGLGPAPDHEGQADRLLIDLLHVPSRGAGLGEAEAAARDAAALLAAERMLLDAADAAPTPSGDTAAILAAAREAGVPLRLVEPGQSPGTTGASEAALARMSERLDAGFRLLVPATPPSVGGAGTVAWWTIDPATGAVRDEHESGRHQVSAETAAGEARTVSYVERLRRFGCRIARPAATAALLVYGATGFASGTAVHEVLETVAEAMEAEAERRAERRAAESAACSGT